jgi:hypothetical protein
MGPFEAQFLDARGDSVGARIVFDNDAELPSGTSVELLALGSYLHPEGVTPAAFEPVATGVVSTDGARIEMADGEHVDLLTWIGIRAVNGAPP